MRRCKRPSMNQEETGFYQIPIVGSEEEIQRICEFMMKLKNMDDKMVFDLYVDSMTSYLSGDLSSMDLIQRVHIILGNHEVLLGEFFQLLSDLDYLGRNSIKGKKQPDVEAINAWLNEEVKTFLFDSCLRKAKRDLKTNQEDKQTITENGIKVTPSYWIRPGAKVGSSSRGVLNDKYFSEGHLDPEKQVKRRSLLPQEERMNNLEDKLLEEDLFLHALKSVVEFGKREKLCEPRPMKFNEVIEWFYEGEKMKVPPIFQSHPNLALQAILPRLWRKMMAMEIAKFRRLRRIYRRNRKNNVNK